LRTELRRNPDRPAFGTDLRLRGRRLVLRVQNVEAGIEECVLVRDLSDRALPLGTPDIVVFDDEGRESQALQVRAAEGQRANGAADLETLLKTAACFLAVAAIATGAFPQVTPAAGVTPPDDAPKVNVGATMYADYTYTDSPTSKDTDGNVIHPSAFNITRAYINITGNLNHLFAFRITPDVSRETSTGPSLSGSQIFRLKYAYAQLNLDDWTTKGSWV